VKTINVSVPDPLEDFIQQKVASGGYSSASEVVREGLRLLQQYDDERLRTLRAAIRKGMESGEGRLLDEITTEDIEQRGTERLRQTRAPNDGTARALDRTAEPRATIHFNRQ
jgi:antitoxin ParD1/3/4